MTEKINVANIHIFKNYQTHYLSFKMESGTRYTVLTALHLNPGTHAYGTAQRLHAQGTQQKQKYPFNQDAQVIFNRKKISGQ